jgi:hypothetical protein
MRRAVAILMSSSFCAWSACGPEIASTAVLASSEQTTGDESDLSDEDKTAWLVITAILVVTTVVGVVSAVSGEGMFAYMQEHQQDVRRALAGGGGPFPSDLTHSLGLSERDVPRVSRILREGRRWLAPHVDEGPITADGAREFWGQLLVLLAADPVTGPALERLERRADEIIEGRAGT